MPWYEFVFEDELGRKYSEIEQNTDAAYISAPSSVPKIRLIQVKFRDKELWNPKCDYAPQEIVG